ncbi:hypothetical protein ACFQZX_02565 [Mucilaginibacter litoreus]|uniref:GyrI-like small molecule binding domain-containing protein n=1 Tax=Mucilaginibacter litoreus TaxID=1048221 RepID=A0ABW3AP45_9SPHI
MKKPALIILGILLLAFISIYFIIPQKIQKTNIIEIDANDINVAKFLVNKRAWPKWWPGKSNRSDSNNYEFNNAVYQLKNNTNIDIYMQVKHEKLLINDKASYRISGDGACKVIWESEVQSSINPVKRIEEFISMNRHSNDIDNILIHFKKFMQTDTNVYGMTIKLTKVKNPIVLAGTINTAEYPKPAPIYRLINDLKKQIKAEGAIQLDSPMLNVNPVDKGYESMVAITINKDIKPGQNMVINHLVKNANLLGVQVKGGKNTILNAFEQLKRYQNDHRLISPAMPYEVLITNRLTQPDTSKWVTNIYWPIF